MDPGVFIHTCICRKKPSMEHHRVMVRFSSKQHSNQKRSLLYNIPFSISRATLLDRRMEVGKMSNGKKIRHVPFWTGNRNPSGRVPKCSLWTWYGLNVHIYIYPEHTYSHQHVPFAPGTNSSLSHVGWLFVFFTCARNFSKRLALAAAWICKVNLYGVSF